MTSGRKTGEEELDGWKKGKQLGGGSREKNRQLKKKKKRAKFFFSAKQRKWTKNRGNLRGREENYEKTLHWKVRWVKRARTSRLNWKRKKTTKNETFRTGGGKK